VFFPSTDGTKPKKVLTTTSAKATPLMHSFMQPSRSANHTRCRRQSCNDSARRGEVFEHHGQVPGHGACSLLVLEVWQLPASSKYFERSPRQPD
jgi:hypothetical protein